MADHPLQDFIRRLRHARSVAEDGHLSDVQLLERFANQRDEAAFEVLVWRHGALVLHVARRLLRRGADAEDVFQATFLTLARKAASIRRGTAVGSWLYKVAYRIALRMRQATAQCERREQTGIEQAAAIAPSEDADVEMTAVLADEVNRLPERHRAAVVLCYLQGVTTEEAARVLGCPRGTVLSRLASARQRLRSRLIRRGLAPAVALAGVSFGEAASAMPPIALVASVVKAALPFAAGRAAISIVSPQAAALARGALQAMMWNKIKIAVAMVCVLGLAGTGAGWLARGRAGAEAALPTAEPSLNKVAPRAATTDAEEKIKKEIGKIHAQLDMLAVAEEKEESHLAQEAVEARLRVVECQDQLRVRREELDDEEKDKNSRIWAFPKNIAQFQQIIQDLDNKNAGESPTAKAAKKRIEKLEREFEKEKASLKKWKGDYPEFLRAYRKQLFQAEEALRRTETKQVRQRETFAAKRDALLDRLQQLEEMSLHLDPNNRFRELERRLDALRRDVGELRHSLERPKDR